MKKLISLVLTLIFVLSLVSCQHQNQDDATPTDLSFSLTWGCGGDNSYDSAAGRLAKRTPSTHPDDAVATYHLTGEEKAFIYDLIAALDIDSYPDVYDPHPNMLSSPSMTLVLTVNQNGTQKTVTAKNIALPFSSDDEKGQAFLSTCKAIIDLLTATEEWKALPMGYLYE